MKVNFILAAAVMQRETNTGFDSESAKINLSVNSLTVEPAESTKTVYFDLWCSLQQPWAS